MRHGPSCLRRLATNGPRGRALVEELIPHIEKTFPASPGVGPAAQRPFLGGLEQPLAPGDVSRIFGGTWSTSPDPVDFRDFQRIDLYARGENMFRDRDGNRRPIARRGAGRSCSSTTFPGWRTSSATAASSARSRPSSARSGRRQPAPALGPGDRRDRSRGRQGVGGVRYPARPGAELAAARPQAGRQAPRHHRRPRHVLSRRGRPAPQGVARRS